MTFNLEQEKHFIRGVTLLTDDWSLT